MLKLIVGYGAIACALPYLALKIVWLSGGTLGAAKPDIMRDSSMIVLNAVTAGMDLVGIGLALAFTHRWGLRIPAWLLLPPMWVASGLLARFVVGVPLAAVLNALISGGLPRVTGGPVQPWVYVVVYVEFAGLGIGLMLAFLLYAKARWVQGLPSSATWPGATRDVEVALANSMGPVTLALGVLYFVQAFHARTIVGSLNNGIDAALMMGAAAGVLMLVHGRGSRMPLWVPIAMAWVGGGSLFAWGLWQTINVLSQTMLVRSAAFTPFANLVGLLRLILGLVIGLLTVFFLASLTGEREKRPTASST
jgi:hypothetical protein